uniref:HIG1 domain-containing protein n=1 Tax=Trieres chinensis TaxID=1514140 RepID=A0A7S2A7B6_TRICV|mmetsp:Transcript_5798/g.12113  ORF Transcript_5798/g.12113 Transcript_5798/m.12113 type:complete len:130 (+) Transcript_5798:127-516(+)|eukprot:CAMPEP_0183314396 /NCGR_PEP_ID=MMETSP0160_2-20130417/48293_1 /TAXON_ID=2839 ORGANISM="Odontella Sinensis, Strain Grunow 1884" /NCGR_SAMPLE_ID=MMETSP0160_2 /ASSEMBLY_ACC=CAM_ASM_000250 /LENGTH=129 /DNA_ID=CAMNT_0025479717 /DNA_START=73 /DNA_END=462 /DNA_ORIENTATION=+
MGAQASRTKTEGPIPSEGGTVQLVPDDTEIPPMPRMQKVETFEEKLYRKFTSEPLVPLGCAVTAYFLGSGIKSFYNRDAARSQKMMRLRVAAQMSTIAIFVGYAGFDAFTTNLRPKQYGTEKAENRSEK